MAPIYCVIPPASPAWTLVFLSLSRISVLPVSTWPRIQTIGHLNYLSPFSAALFLRSAICFLIRSFLSCSLFSFDSIESSYLSSNAFFDSSASFLPFFPPFFCPVDSFWVFSFYFLISSSCFANASSLSSSSSFLIIYGISDGPFTLSNKSSKSAFSQSSISGSSSSFSAFFFLFDLFLSKLSSSFFDVSLS